MTLTRLYHATELGQLRIAGFIAHGGKIADVATAAGDKFYGIVGRGIYAAKDMHEAAVEHTSQI